LSVSKALKSNLKSLQEKKDFLLYSYNYNFSAPGSEYLEEYGTRFSELEQALFKHWCLTKKWQI